MHLYWGFNNVTWYNQSERFSKKRSHKSLISRIHNLPRFYYSNEHYSTLILEWRKRNNQRESILLPSENYTFHLKTIFETQVKFSNFLLSLFHVMVSCAVCISETVESVHVSEYNNCLVYRSVIININLCSHCLKYVHIRKLKGNIVFRVCGNLVVKLYSLWLMQN